MDAFYYVTYIDDYATLSLIYTCNNLNNLLLIALLEMVYITFQHVVCNACNTSLDVMDAF